MGMIENELNEILIKAVSNGYITPIQKSNALIEYNKNGDLSILETIEIEKAASLKREKIIHTSWNELSDKDALRIIVKQNRTMIDYGRTISGWVTFIGILMIINIIGAIILASQL